MLLQDPRWGGGYCGTLAGWTYFANDNPGLGESAKVAPEGKAIRLFTGRERTVPLHLEDSVSNRLVYIAINGIKRLELNRVSRRARIVST